MLFQKFFLEQLDIHLYSRVVEIGGIKDKGLYDVDMFKNNVDKNDVRVIDENIAQQMRDKIDEAKKTEIQSGRSSSNGWKHAYWSGKLCTLWP